MKRNVPRKAPGRREPGAGPPDRALLLTVCLFNLREKDACVSAGQATPADMQPIVSEEMAREDESFANALFETLSDWERALQAENIEDLEDVA